MPVRRSPRRKAPAAAPDAGTTAAPAPPTTSVARQRPGPGGRFEIPFTVSHPALLCGGTDDRFRETLYQMVLAFGRLITCREAFGRAIGLTGSQFAVLVGTAYRQGDGGVTIRVLADHVLLAPTHVTTEVGRLIRKGLLVKRPNAEDGRSVLVSLSPRGEAAILELSPFLQRINDLLFENVSQAELAALSAFLEKFVANSDRAVAEIRRTDAARKSLEP